MALAQQNAQPTATQNGGAHSQSQPQHAPASPSAQDRKRVKVYELKNNDWYDRGTGFCSGQIFNTPNSSPENPDARIIVTSEDDPGRTLLETRITKEDGYQKQQDTLIVWTEQTGVDMALSFQEAEGCSGIWEFVSDVQTRLGQLAPDDGLSDDLLDPAHPIVLPEPHLGRLDEVENGIRGASATHTGRDALVKFVMSPEQMYILKLGALVEMAEDLEATQDLHKLCNIMKHLILLNDPTIIEFVVRDEAITGVVGALEYDPDFPSHRANHRAYLSDSSKFKEVVHIDDPNIRHKIHYTYRLLYLKDVVLARILDDPTFSVLNGLIFFNQVEIVNHLQCNHLFLKELFAIFGEEEKDVQRKKEAVLFIQNCCAVSKNIQVQHRAQLYSNFIHHPYGLFTVITYALRHQDASVRVAGTDILVALIDHDADMVRSRIFKAIKEKQTPLTDTLIELLLVEVDLGVKSQMADAIKILLDPTANNGMELMNRQQQQGANNNNSEFVAKQRGGAGNNPAHPNGGPVQPQTEAFIQSFYDDSAKRLFRPLKDLEHRSSMLNLTVHETSLFTHLVEVLCFFVRQHSYKSKLFVLSEQLHARVAQLLACPQKHMKLTALKWFRTCVGLQDEFHNRHLMSHNLFKPILDLVYETMPRDNLLNSACLELFEYIKRESVKGLIVHLVEGYRERLMGIGYVNTFQALVLKYDQMQAGYLPAHANGGDEVSFETTREGTPSRPPATVNGGQRFAGLREMDGDEEAYFNGVDEENEDEEQGLPTSAKVNGAAMGASPVRPPLVDYPEDDEEDDAAMEAEMLASSSSSPEVKKSGSSSSDLEASEPMDISMDDDDERGRDRRPVPVAGSPGHQQQSPPEPLAVKRRREDEDEDELGKMMGVKRRNSSASLAGQAARMQMDGAASPANSHHTGGDENGGLALNLSSSLLSEMAAAPKHGHMLRRKGSLKTKNESGTGSGRFAIKPISLAAAKAAVESQPACDEESEDGGGNG